MLQGLDVSSVQGLVDWTKVDPAIRFVYAKCGEGNTEHKDPYFDANVRGCQETGRVVGAYHFPYPLPAAAGHANRDPVVQANEHFAFAGGLGTLAGHLPAIMDLEWPAPEKWGAWGCSAGQIKDWALAYLEEYDRLSGGRKTGVYIYPYFAKMLGDLTAFKGRVLWLASYQKVPAVVAPWIVPDIWQNTGGGGRLYNGVPVDTNVIVSEAKLQELTAAYIPL